ncbi:hypothetical protein BD324DRAFT_629254 [Kockovaella imperatae]|uniref:phosphatidylinositol-3,4,5-trisphosphate 3-phosphatase n=1 Tax=Kockovaella imperatae TaxID=4999 RepID=A0A1Y1UCS6_9TREE|nr:hypothetical protein BD324DRAFT_629254 [Kockovaella imperatae]ORX35851.1 hypothetical protein BD324DRAFT_629254 [Kockovaella imperatae]
MSLDYIRKIVSGKKARFVDKAAQVDLDLVYVTDRIIIMGYPAAGVSALYRNRRRDVLKFINSRHGDKWWIWNLCPLYEKAYSPESMHNRVSRYPFPDHHPPPLPLLPLAVREMTAWLQGDPERIAIIHCKAGKGRSGTLLCSYLLSLPQLPPPPQLDRSYGHKELKKRLEQRKSEDHSDAGSAARTSLSEEYEHVSGPEAESQTAEMDHEGEGWVIIGGGQHVAPIQVDSSAASASGERAPTPTRSEIIHVDTPIGSVARSTTSSMTTISGPSPPPSIRIAVTTHPVNPIDVGDEGRPGDKGQEDREDGKVDDVFKMHSSRRMKPSSTGRGVSIPSQRRWCRYVNLLFQKHVPPSYLSSEPSRVKLVSITILLHPASGWQKPLASLIVGSDEGNGKAWASVARYDDAYVDELNHRGGSGQGVRSEITWGGVGGDGRYDTHKMFRSCGKMVPGDLSEEIRDAMPGISEGLNVHHLVPQVSEASQDLILDRNREVRLKYHLGSLPLGWSWLIPAFHLPEPTTSGAGLSIHTLTLPRSQLDFAVGPGSSVHSIHVRFQDVASAEGGNPARLLSEDEEKKTGMKDDMGEGMVKEEAAK